VTAKDLLSVPTGTITEDGLRANIRVGVQYLEAWLGGNGCVPLYNLMEDAATAEISRAQIWQWLAHNAALADGRKITTQLYDEILPQEMVRIEKKSATSATIREIMPALRNCSAKCPRAKTSQSS